MRKRPPAAVELVADILEDYAQRGTFKGFARGPVRGGMARFRMLWHRDQFFDLILDTSKKTLRFPVVLPKVPARSEMYRELQNFVASRQSGELPKHRTIEPKKALVRTSNRAGNVALTILVRGGDYEYATRKLIHLVHEIYLAFLYDGPYYDYMVETFGLDPDHM